MIRVCLPPPAPETAKFSWEYAKHPPQTTGIHFLPKAISRLLPWIGVLSALMILTSAFFSLGVIITSEGKEIALSGDVYATEGGETRHLSGVRLEISEKGLITSTDVNGRFEFPPVPIGEYTLILTLVNYSTSEYHIVAFPKISETFHLEMKPGTDRNRYSAGSFHSLYEIYLTFYSSTGELILVSSFLCISAYLILKRKHIFFILGSFALGILSLIFMARELELSWYIGILGAGLSFAGAILTWLGKDEFFSTTEWTIDQDA